MSLACRSSAGKAVVGNWASRRVAAKVGFIFDGTVRRLLVHRGELLDGWIATLTRDDPRVPSLTGLWPGAEWMEREAYDMFGIIFEGNRDLRRIYMPPDYTSFPLRKDFYLPDDAARSPGAGVRHVERTHSPVDAAPGVLRRTGA